MDRKQSNPKDAVGIRKVGTSCVPTGPIMEAGLAMLEGARKYGRHNYRETAVRASVYYDAQKRHMDAWWEGQNIDPDSRLHHLAKAIACLVVLRDAMLCGKFVDDRPPALYDENWIAELNKLAGEIIDKYPDAKEPFTEERRLAEEVPHLPLASRDALSEEDAFAREFDLKLARGIFGSSVDPQQLQQGQPTNNGSTAQPLSNPRVVAEKYDSNTMEQLKRDGYIMVRIG